MHEESRAILIQDLVALLGVGRDNLDTLVIRPRRTSNGLLVMVEAGKLRLVYPQAGWLDFVRVWHFWRCGLRNKLSPRPKRWGHELVHRVALGTPTTRSFRRSMNLPARWRSTCYVRASYPNHRVPPNKRLKLAGAHQ